MGDNPQCYVLISCEELDASATSGATKCNCGITCLRTCSNFNLGLGSSITRGKCDTNDPTEIVVVL